MPTASPLHILKVPLSGQDSSLLLRLFYWTDLSASHFKEAELAPIFKGGLLRTDADSGSH